MILQLDSNHNLNKALNRIGVDSENDTDELTIFIEDTSLWSFIPYLEFMVNGEKYSTEALEINQEDGSFSYKLPNGILKEGVLEAQVVLRKQDGDKQYIWKSVVKKFVVEKSINAGEEIAEEYPDFILVAQELIDKLEEYDYEFEKLKTIEEGAQVNRIEHISKNGVRLPIDTITKNVNIDLSEYALGSEAGNRISVEMNPETYVITFKLYDRNNNILNTQEIDLPIESVVVSGRYDNTTKSIILTLQNGSIINIPVGDLIGGLQSEITPSNMLDSDLVDDTNNVHKFVSQNEKDKLRDIEANAQVNKFEGLKVNGVALPIDNNKQSNLDLTGYVLKTNLGAVPVEDIRALFHNEESGGDD